jgi:hypothetical protein
MRRLRFTLRNRPQMFFDIHVLGKASQDCLLEHYKDDHDFVISTTTNGLKLFHAVSDAIAHVEQERKDIPD